MRPLVTVYITNNNYGIFLKKSIQSVLDQSYKNIYLIIVDDNSNDNSKKILKEYKSKDKIKIIYNKKKRGLIKNANLAIKNSKGKFILRLDADDYLRKDAIKLMIKKIKNNRGAKMIFPDFYNVNVKSKIKSIFKYKHKLYYNFNDQPAHGACSLINLQFLKKIGGYNETFNRQDGHYLWYSILFKKFNILHINKPLFFYRKHKKNLSKNKKKILYNRLKIINYFLKKYHYVQELTHQKKLTKKKIKRLH